LESPEESSWQREHERRGKIEWMLTALHTSPRSKGQSNRDEKEEFSK
jgi:hypothetical protein